MPSVFSMDATRSTIFSGTKLVGAAGGDLIAPSQIREHFHVQSARNVSEIVYELRNIIRESENVQLLPYSRLRLPRNCFSGPAIRCRAEHTDAAPLAQEHAPTLRD
jgi:hypothetical protein